MTPKYVKYARAFSMYRCSATNKTQLWHEAYKAIMEAVEEEKALKINECFTFQVYC